jgi:death-on-curing protein
MLEAIHDAQLREHGGSPGIRDEALLASALARPRHKFAYAERADLATFAAAYAFGLVKNHGFIDANKRAAFMASYVFLDLNGQDLEAAEPDVVTSMEHVADGHLTEAGLAGWIRARLRPVDR